MKKNEIYEVTIEDMSAEGEGIGHIYETENSQMFQEAENGSKAVSNSGLAVFVKDTVVGDVAKIRIIKLKRNYAYGRLEELISPSPFRVEAPCPKARSCGGCTLMHISYAKQLEYKQNQVRNCLERIGGVKNVESLMEPICGMETPYHYRNKMQLPVGVNKEGKVQIGFYARRTHSIIDLEHCEIGHPIHTYLIEELRQWLQKWQDMTGSFLYDEEHHTGLVRHIVTRIGFTTGEFMVCLVLNGDDFPESVAGHTKGAGLSEADAQDTNGKDFSCGAELLERVQSSVIAYNQNRKDTEKEITLASLCININKEKTNRILGTTCKTLWGNPYITDQIGEVKFHISPLSFYQVNPVQTKVLYDKALEYAGLTDNEILWDMYCGIGTISLYMAKKAKKVYGVEIVPQAIEDARKNAELNGINHVEFFCGKAEEVVPEFYQNGEQQGRHPDVVVVDPPRKGCDEVLLETIVQMAPKRVVYVSCDPGTLARDVKRMGELGYEVKRVGVVDQFCQSGNVETCVLLSHKSRTDIST